MLLHWKLDYLLQEERLNRARTSKIRTSSMMKTRMILKVDIIQHQKIVDNVQPIRRPRYQTPYALREKMKFQIGKMLDKALIRESNSPWSAPDILVPKESPNFDLRRFSSTKFSDQI